MKKGMSLIVLVITILVMIILAGVVVIGLSNNNPMEQAHNATVMSDYSTAKTQFSLYAANKLASSTVKQSGVDQVTMDSTELGEMVAKIDYNGNFSFSTTEVVDDPATIDYNEEEQNYYKIKDDAYKGAGVKKASVGYYAANRMGNIILILPATSNLESAGGVYKET